MGYAERISRHKTVLLTDGDYIWHPAAIQDALDADAEIAALRARVEALEAGLEVIAANADMMCCDTATSAMLLRKTLRETRDAARALLEEKS